MNQSSDPVIFYSTRLPGIIGGAIFFVVVRAGFYGLIWGVRTEHIGEALAILVLTPLLMALTSKVTERFKMEGKPLFASTATASSAGPVVFTGAMSPRLRS